MDEEEIGFFKELCHQELEDKSQIENKIYTLLALVQLFYPVAFYLRNYVQEEGIMNKSNLLTNYFFTSDWYWFNFFVNLFLFFVVVTTILSICCIAGYRYIKLPEAARIHVHFKYLKRYYNRNIIALPDVNKESWIKDKRNEWQCREYVRVAQNNRKMNEAKEKYLNLFAFFFYLTFVIGIICLAFYLKFSTSY